MKQVTRRILLVGIVNLLLFELLMQVSVRWRESSGELVLMAQTALLGLAIIWAILPVFRNRPHRLAYSAALGIGLFFSFAALTDLYSWHVRPNLGLYREPAWVSQHPGFQRSLRDRIEANRWR